MKGNKTAMSQDIEHSFYFELIHSLTFNGFIILSPAHNHKIVSNMHTFSILGVLGIEIPAVTCISHQM